MRALGLITGLAVGLGLIAAGLYVGIVLCFVGPIVDLVLMIQNKLEPTAGLVAWDVAKFFLFVGPSIWLGVVAGLGVITVTFSENKRL